jgi:hypothetical protein
MLSVCRFITPTQKEPGVIFVEQQHMIDFGDLEVIAGQLWSTFTPPTQESTQPTVPVFKPHPHVVRTPVKRKHTPKHSNHGEVTKKLRDWISKLPNPYSTREENIKIAKELGVSQTQVSNFCNNHRKRFMKTAVLVEV